MLKEMKPGRKYIIINTDEPYAEAVYAVLKCGQIAKGQWPEGDITYKEWLAQTFPEAGEREEMKRKDDNHFQLTLAEANQLRKYILWAEESERYYGNKKQFKRRHKKIRDAFGIPVDEES